MGAHAGIRKVRKVILECMNNIHPVYNIKRLMILRELEKDPKLATEDWTRFLPTFKKKNVPRRKPHQIKMEMEKNKRMEQQQRNNNNNDDDDDGGNTNNNNNDNSTSSNINNKKKKRTYTPFPPQQKPSKVDLMLDSGEYFLNERDRKAKAMIEKRVNSSVKSQLNRIDKMKERFGENIVTTTGEGDNNTTSTDDDTTLSNYNKVDDAVVAAAVNATNFGNGTISSISSNKGEKINVDKIKAAFGGSGGSNGKTGTSTTTIVGRRGNSTMKDTINMSDFVEGVNSNNHSSSEKETTGEAIKEKENKKDKKEKKKKKKDKKEKKKQKRDEFDAANDGDEYGGLDEKKKMKKKRKI